MKRIAIYEVGGSVRDGLLDLPEQDRDWVVVGANPQYLADRGYKLVGKHFPVFLHPETKEEYALARTETKIGKGYTGFSVFANDSVSLEDDLKRRDLTINAMARTAEGHIIDPYGGQKDIVKRQLRHVSQAFAEDPLRILRVARLLARLSHLGFYIAPDTEALMQNMCQQGMLKELSANRVWEEVYKALLTPHPEVFFRTLYKLGGLQDWFPEVHALFGITQLTRWHPEIDVGVHTLMVMEQARKLNANPLVSFCALTHDLGKVTTPQSIIPRHVGHERRGGKLIEALCKRLPIPKNFMQCAKQVARAHGLILRINRLSPLSCLCVLESVDAFRRPQQLDILLACCQADFCGRRYFADKRYVQKQQWLDLFECLQQLDLRAITHTTLEGSAKHRAIRQARIDCIKRFKQSR